MNRFFDLILLCGLLMEGRMTEEEKKTMLQRDFHDLTPCQWQKDLLANSILEEDDELYRMFWRAGIFDTEEMTKIVLEYWYLYHRTK